MLGFLIYYAKWCEVLSNALWILHLYNSSDLSSAQHYFFHVLYSQEDLL